MNSGKNLIFVISQPRAGSTLLQRILGAHPDIHTTSEPWISLHPLSALRPEGTSANYSHALAHRATVEFLDTLPGGQDTYYEGVRRMLGHLYNTALAPSGRSIFLDKTPRYYFIISELRRTFPDARFVFLLRNPLAVFTSIMETWVKGVYFGKLCALRNDLVHDLLTAPDFILNGIQEFGSEATVIRYEDLVGDPIPTVRRLCQQLGISFHPEMIEYGSHGRNTEHWRFGDQGTIYEEKAPVSARASRWPEVLRGTPPWLHLGQAYFHALGRTTIEDMGYKYEEIQRSLEISDSFPGQTDFLNSAVLNYAYGETRDFVYQLQYFQGLIARHRAADERTANAAAGYTASSA